MSSPILRAEIPEVSPLRGLLYTPKEIANVRQIAEENALLRSVAQQFVQESERWVNMSRDDLQQLFPSPDAVFAYGFAGDPKVNKPWSWWGRDGEASLEQPFVVKSRHTGDIYGNQKAGEEFYDNGKGWKRPSDGKVFYFKGVWNAHVVRILHEAVDNLSLAYMLTGKEEYAERALLILDRFATLRSKRSANDGPIDWPHPVGPGYGFFLYAGNVANDRMVASALAFDLVGKAPAATKPSPDNPNLTIFENIRRNYFSVFEKGYIENRNNFQNHAVSAYANLMTQAVLFGYPEDIRTGIEAAYGFLDNAIGRDGEYYELSSTYVYLGRIYGSRLLAPLTHYAPDNYSEPEKFPAPSHYSSNLRFADDPVWFNTVVASLYRLTTLYRQSQYGDAPPDRFTPVRTGTTGPENLGSSIFARQKAIYLKLFYQSTSNPQWKQLCSQLYWQLPEPVRHNVKYMREGILEFGPSQWVDIPQPDEAAPALPRDLQENASVVAGQKRLAILRSGEGAKARALLIRGGSAASHCHNDQMAISLYSHGLSLTGEYGYKLAGTPDHRGWGVQSVAHKMVVVDEDLHAPIPGNAVPPAAHNPPARIDGMVPYGPAQLVEMANPGQWQGVALEDYRRQTWLVDLPGDQGYFVDFFWVDGGRIHDYVWNAPFVEPPVPGEPLRLEGVSPCPQKDVWALAALGNPKYRKETFNQPGKSWGERLEVGSGTIRNLGIPQEKLASHDWNPAPGNGYGFIWDVKTADTKEPWSATWLLHDKKHSIKLSMLNPDGQTVITGKTPTLTAGCAQEVVIARRQATGKRPLRSRFATVSQVAENDDWSLTGVKWIEGVDENSVGLRITQNGGFTDTILASNSPIPKIHTAEARLDGRRAFVRRSSDGRIDQAMLSEGTLLQAGEFGVRLPRPAWEGTVTRVSPREIQVDTALPPNAVFEGLGVAFSSPPESKIPYSSNEFFMIEAMRQETGGTLFTFQNQTVSAGRLKVERKQGDGLLKTCWPNEIAAVPEKLGNRSRLFEGHMLMSATNDEGVGMIEAYLKKNLLRVDRSASIEEGHSYWIMATQPGDKMRIPSLAIVKRLEDGMWSVRANMDVEVKLPGLAGRPALAVEDGAPVPLSLSADGFIQIPAALLLKGEGKIIAPGNGE